jgi:hypothetical protein
MAPSISFCPYFLHWYPSNKSGADVTTIDVPLCCFFLLQQIASNPSADQNRSTSIVQRQILISDQPVRAYLLLQY